jgi:osmotically-inducible protein OsmY
MNKMPNFMRNYNDEIEAAYITSIRQGNMLRDRQRERSSHEDRRNRYLENTYRYSDQRYGDNTTSRSEENNYRYQDTGHQRMMENRRGKGPRNYRRSDERVRENVCEVFYEHPGLDATGIEVEVKDGDVILMGSVDDRQAKRLAEDLAETIRGVSNVENRLRVANKTYHNNQVNVGLS